MIVLYFSKGDYPVYPQYALQTESRRQPLDEMLTEVQMPENLNDLLGASAPHSAGIVGKVTVKFVIHTSHLWCILKKRHTFIFM